MTAIEIFDILDHILNFIYPTNSAEFYQFYQLKSVSKLWNQTITELGEKIIFDKWRSHNSFMEDYENWLFNPTTDMIKANPISIVGYTETDNFFEDDPNCPYLHLMHSYPGEEYGGFGKMISIDINITDKKIVSDEIVEFNVCGIGIYRKLIATLWCIRIKWYWNQNRIELIKTDEQNKYLNIKKLIGSMFCYQINYHGLIFEPKFTPPIESFQFIDENRVKIRQISAIVDIWYKVISNDLYSYQFEVKVRFKRKIRIFTFRWFPATSKAIITTPSHDYYASRKLILIIKQLFIFEINVSDPFQPEATFAYGSI